MPSRTARTRRGSDSRNDGRYHDNRPSKGRSKPSASRKKSRYYESDSDSFSGSQSESNSDSGGSYSDDDSRSGSDSSMSYDRRDRGRRSRQRGRERNRRRSPSPKDSGSNSDDSYTTPDSDSGDSNSQVSDDMREYGPKNGGKKNGPKVVIGAPPRGNQGVSKLAMQAALALQRRKKESPLLRASLEQRKVREVDYDQKPTQLYQFIEKKMWREAAERCRTSPTDAKTWVYRTNKKGDIMWRMLPVHTAVLYRAPVYVLLDILDANPNGPFEQDDREMLPIHMACRIISKEDVVRLLLKHHPDSVESQDIKGRTPMQYLRDQKKDKTQSRALQKVNARNRKILMKLLTEFENERMVSRDDDISFAHSRRGPRGPGSVSSKRRDPYNRRGQIPRRPASRQAPVPRSIRPSSRQSQRPSSRQSQRSYMKNTQALRERERQRDNRHERYDYDDDRVDDFRDEAHDDGHDEEYYDEETEPPQEPEVQETKRHVEESEEEKEDQMDKYTPSASGEDAAANEEINDEIEKYVDQGVDADEEFLSDLWTEVKEQHDPVSELQERSIKKKKSDIEKKPSRKTKPLRFYSPPTELKKLLSIIQSTDTETDGKLVSGKAGLPMKMDNNARRVNACGALKALAKNEKNRLRLARTKGVVSSLCHVLNDKSSTKEERLRCSATLLSLCVPSQNWDALVTVHVTLFETLTNILENETDRVLYNCCFCVFLLAKSEENKSRIIEYNPLTKAMANVLQISVQAIKGTDDAQNDNLGSPSGIRQQGSPSNDEESKRGARLSTLKAVLSFSKSEDTCSKIVKNEELLVALAKISGTMPQQENLLCMAVFTNLTRQKDSCQYIMETYASFNKAVVDGLTSDDSGCQKCAILALQNLSCDKICSRKIAKLPNALPLIAALTLEKKMKDEIRVSAVHTLKNICNEPSCVVPLTENPGVTATLFALASDNSNPGLQYIASDALATLSEWLYTSAETCVKKSEVEYGTLGSKVCTWDQWH